VTPNFWTVVCMYTQPADAMELLANHTFVDEQTKQTPDNMEESGHTVIGTIFIASRAFDCTPLLMVSHRLLDTAHCMITVLLHPWLQAGGGMGGAGVRDSPSH